MIQTSGKRTSYETSYIDSEHDYLSVKAPIVNNNTIMAGDHLPCANGGCSHRGDEGDVDILVPYAEHMHLDQEVEGHDSNGNKTEEEMSVVEDEGTSGPVETASSAKKRKASKPKKNGAVATASANKMPNNLRLALIMLSMN